MCLVSWAYFQFFIINYYINQSERARKNRRRLGNIPCLFNARHQEHDGVDFARSSHDDDEQEEYFAPTTAGECIQFWPWVNRVSNKHSSVAFANSHLGNKTPMTISPDLPLEIVMQIFKRLGWVNKLMFETPTNLMDSDKTTYHPCRRPWSAVWSVDSEGRSEVHSDWEAWTSTVLGWARRIRWTIRGDMAVD